MNEDELRNTLTRVADRARPSLDTLDKIKTSRHKLERRRRATAYGSTLAGLVALAVVAVQVLPNGGKDPGGFATGNPNPPAAQYDVDLVVSNDGRTLTVWSPSDSSSTSFDIENLAPGENVTDNAWMRFARLDDNGTLRYVVTDGAMSTVWEKANPRTDIAPVKVLGLNGSILAIDYRSNGNLAYLTDADQQIAAFTLSRSSTPELVWTFPQHLGRGVGPDDDLQVAWSRDGNFLLLGNTYVDMASERSDEMVIVLDSEGRKVVSPFDGTHARWIDNTRIAYVPYSANLGNRWRILDLTTNEETKLDIDIDMSARPAVSPDGKLLAVEDSDNDSIIVLDIDANEPITISNGGAAPVWFDDHTLMTTELERCPEVCPEVDYDGIKYRETRRVQLIDINDPDAPRTIASISSTRDASVSWKVSSDSGTEG